MGASSCSVRHARQPDRRRRGGRAPRLGGQGTAGEQPRRRCHAQSTIDLEAGGAKLIRVRDDGGGIDAGGPAAGAGAPRHQQDRLAGRPGARAEPRLSRRGAGQHRLGVAPAARPPRPPARAHAQRGWSAPTAAMPRSSRPRRIRAAPRSRCATCSSTPRRGASSCAAETHRVRPLRRSRASAWRCRVSMSASRCATTARSAASSLRPARRPPSASSAWPRSAGRLPASRRWRSTSRPSGLRLSGWVGAADVLAQPGRSAVLLRQRPRRARQAGHARGAAGLSGCAVPRPPSGLCAVPAKSIRARSMSTCIRPSTRCVFASRGGARFPVPRAAPRPGRVRPGGADSCRRERRRSSRRGPLRDAAARRDAARAAGSSGAGRSRAACRGARARPSGLREPSPALPHGAADRAAGDGEVPPLGYALAQLQGDLSSSPRTRRAWCWSTCTPRTSASPTSA